MTVWEERAGIHCTCAAGQAVGMVAAIADNACAVRCIGPDGTTTSAIFENVSLDEAQEIAERTLHDLGWRAFPLAEHASCPWPKQDGEEGPIVDLGEG